MSAGTTHTSAAQQLPPPAAGGASWKWSDSQLLFQAEPVEPNGLEVRISTTAPQTLTWPVTPPMSKETQLIWPLGGGVLIDASDGFWQKELLAQDWDAAESMSFPAFGLIRDNQTFSWISATPFRDTLAFRRQDDSLVLSATHTFSSRASSMTATYRFFLEDKTNPLAPAQQYRRFMQETGNWKTLEQKAAETSSVALLKGAPHGYLWGAAAISAEDILPAKWQSFTQSLLQNEATSGSMAARLRPSFSAEQWKAVTDAASLQHPYIYLKNEITTAISEALLHRNLSGDDATTSPSTMSAEELLQNSRALAAAFPGTFQPVDEWGGGISVRMLKELQAAGLQHFRLCTDGQEELALRPWVAKFSQTQGWLLGTYDSYHSVHPTTISINDTWPTAQMTDAIFQSGTVVGLDGKHLTGFKGIGRKVNSIAVHDFAHSRIQANFSEVPYNYYFIDCDATGEIFDDYSPEHPTSREADAAERMARLDWISKTLGAATGSEGGHAYAVSHLAVAEGVAGPFFGWDEPAMKDANSPHYRGRYWPADAPDVYFKPVALMERFKKKFYDPATRIPLYQAAFHDSIVTSPHWSNGFYKYPEVQAITALTSLLYLSPPLYHLNPAEFARRKADITAFYQTWSPLHQRYGFSPLTEFKYLTEDRLVQEARYGDECRVIANFSRVPVQINGDLEIAPLTAAIIAPKIWKAPRFYTAPSPSLPANNRPK